MASQVRMTIILPRCKWWSVQREFFQKIKRSHYQYKVGNNLGLLPTLYYHCNAMISDDYNVKQYILDYAQNHEQFEINQLVTAHIHFQTSRFSNLSLMMIY